ncbi:MAG: hypothetical protein DRI57_22905 [Deltaproteobacteria bacterium]|nr:MAG: hypothetical protein DRI57_22905 [Deltaproteobacteria bacterium]
MRKKSRWEELKWKLVGIFGKLFIDALCRTTEIRHSDSEKVRPVLSSKRFIFAFWHSRILLISYLFQGWDGAILVSQSDDGEVIARVLQRQGHEPIRGSSSRGGLRALARLIKCLRERDRPAVITPDGPRGPRFRVQPGIITLAKKTGYPIVPVTYGAEKRTVFGSWDRFILPHPFTKCRVIYGDPVSVPGDADKHAEERSRIQLEDELCRITVQADRSFGHEVDK